jgi:hypothetical protein
MEIKFYFVLDNFTFDGLISKIPICDNYEFVYNEMTKTLLFKIGTYADKWATFLYGEKATFYNNINNHNVFMELLNKEDERIIHLLYFSGLLISEIINFNPIEYEENCCNNAIKRFFAQKINYAASQEQRDKFLSVNSLINNGIITIDEDENAILFKCRSNIKEPNAFDTLIAQHYNLTIDYVKKISRKLFTLYKEETSSSHMIGILKKPIFKPKLIPKIHKSILPTLPPPIPQHITITKK